MCFSQRKGHAEIGGVFGCIGVPAAWDGLAAMLQRTLVLSCLCMAAWGVQVLHLSKKDVVRSWPGVG